MAHRKSGVGSWDVWTDVTKSNGYIDSVFYSSSGNTKKASGQVCPSFDGLGKFVLGPPNVWADAASGWDYLSRDDFTKGSFYVRAHVKTGLSAKRTGSTVTLNATAKRYDPEKAYAYVNYNPKKAKFQVKSGSKWKTIKTVSLKKGTASYTVKSSKAKNYRFVVDKVNWAAGSTSKTVKK